MNIDVRPVIDAVITLFVVMLIGIAGRFAGILDPKTTRKLSQVLVKITQPMLIISSLQIGYTTQRFKIGLALILISGVTHVVVTLLSAFVFRNHPLKQRKVFMLATIFGNCAFMGFPILEAIFGAEGLLYGAFYTFFFNVYIWTYGTYMLSRGTGKAYNPLKSLLNIGTISCVVSFLMFILKIRLPAPILNAVDSVGHMTFPLAMLIIGSMVAGLGLKRVFIGTDSYFYSVVKLILVPILTLLVCVILQADEGLTLLMVCMTAVPSAANNAIFAEIYDADAPLGAKLVGLSTLFSVVTIPLLLLLTTWILSLVN